MTSTSWYREPWPWLLMAGPAAVVLAGSFTMFLAFRGADGLVADDYYARGLAINRDLARERRAAHDGLSAGLLWDAASGQMTLRVRGATPADLPPVLRLTLSHPVRASLDRTMNVVRNGDGTYFAHLGNLALHRWNVVVECAQWRLSGEWKNPAEPGDIEP